MDKKIEFGIEIISAMKASAYNTDIDMGRHMALEDTELDRLGTHTFEEYEKENDDFKKVIRDFQMGQKKRLHEQAIFVADIAINKYNELFNK